MKIDTFTLY